MVYCRRDSQHGSRVSACREPSRRFRGGLLPFAIEYLTAIVIAGGFLVGSQAQPATLQSGDLVVCDGFELLLQINPATGAQTIISQGGNLVYPGGIVLDANGDVLVANGNAGGLPGSVFRVNVATGAQTIISSGGNLGDALGSDFYPGLTIAADGGILVTHSDFDAGTGSVVRVDPVTRAQTVVTTGGNLIDPSGITVAPNGDIFVGDNGRFVPPFVRWTIIKVNPVTGAQTRLSLTCGFPYSMVWTANGILLAANECGGIFRFDPLTATSQTVAAGGNLCDPLGIAVAQNGAIFVGNACQLNDSAGGAIIGVDPVGEQTVVSSGGNLHDPVGIAVVPTLSVCGNGALEFGEQCDQGSANGAPSSCCTRDCHLRPSGAVCRPARSTLCDTAETCDGIHDACPPDAFAGPDTGCVLEDPCTIKDHCQDGLCVSGIQICSALVGQPCVASSDLFPCRTLGKQPARIIGVRANIDRTNRRGVGRLAALAFEAAPMARFSTRLERTLAPSDVAPFYTCTPLKETDADCLALHANDIPITKRQRAKFSSEGTAVLDLKVNRLARKALNKAGVLPADVCAAIGFKQGRTINLLCSLTLVSHKSG